MKGGPRCWKDAQVKLQFDQSQKIILLGLEHGRRYWGMEAMNGGVVLGGQLYLIKRGLETKSVIVQKAVNSLCV